MKYIINQTISVIIISVLVFFISYLLVQDIVYTNKKLSFKKLIYDKLPGNTSQLNTILYSFFKKNYFDIIYSDIVVPIKNNSVYNKNLNLNINILSYPNNTNIIKSIKNNRENHDLNNQWNILYLNSFDLPEAIKNKLVKHITNDRSPNSYNRKIRNTATIYYDKLIEKKYINQSNVCNYGVPLFITPIIFLYKSENKISDTEIFDKFDDFFDIKEFPGKRVLLDNVMGNMEFAVKSINENIIKNKSKQLNQSKTYETYKSLNDPIVFNKALRKYKNIKDHILWCSNWEQCLNIAIQTPDVSIIQMSYEYYIHNINRFKSSLSKFKIIWNKAILNTLYLTVSSYSNIQQDIVNNFIKVFISPDIIYEVVKSSGFYPIDLDTFKDRDVSYDEFIPIDTSDNYNYIYININKWVDILKKINNYKISPLMLNLKRKKVKKRQDDDI